MIYKSKNRSKNNIWMIRLLTTIISTITFSTEARCESIASSVAQYGLSGANTIGLSVALCALIVLTLGSLVYMVKHHGDANLKNLERDELTELHNWDAGMALARMALQKSQYPSIALVLLDVDDTGDLREACGDAALDAMLVDGARALGELARERDVACRVMNDTFMVCLVEQTASVPYQRKVEALRHAFDLEMIDTEGMVHQVHASAGVALVPTHGKRLMDLYDKADMALYWAKRDGKNRMMVYQDSDAAVTG